MNCRSTFKHLYGAAGTRQLFRKGSLVEEAAGLRSRVRDQQRRGCFRGILNLNHSNGLTAKAGMNHAVIRPERQRRAKKFATWRGGRPSDSCVIPVCFEADVVPRTLHSLTMPRPEPKPKPAEVARSDATKTTSARLATEQAINEFKTQSLALSAEKLKDAYARLMVGRGFKRPHTAPVMTIHSALIAGTSKAAASEATPASPIPPESGETKPPSGDAA
jgi:hypothetical protein